jgi:predicted metal-dependent hydrolase
MASSVDYFNQHEYFEVHYKVDKSLYNISRTIIKLNNICFPHYEIHKYVIH